jgi:hypothetical protein
MGGDFGGGDMDMGMDMGEDMGGDFGGGDEFSDDDLDTMESDLEGAEDVLN